MGRVYTIPGDVAFVDWLARGLLADAAGQPELLGRYTVLLPNRRAARSLRDAFLRISEGQPLLLPRMMALGDLDPEALALGESPAATGGDALQAVPPIDPLARQGLLTRLVAGFQPDRPVDQAASLAAELGSLLDALQTQFPDGDHGFARLADLVPEQFAQHWQITLEFLRLLGEHWPAILAERGERDPAAWRNALLQAQARQWQANPPAGRVVAAGSTGSIPATAQMIATVADLPKGWVVLPGLDTELDEASWAALDASHPQYALKNLLGDLGVDRAAVAPWPWLPPADQRRPERARLVSEALRPPATTVAWPAGPPIDAGATQGLTRIDAADPLEEAGAIAVRMREVLEQQAAGRTCALVTNDRDLARRVAAELARWDVRVDDSGGQPLARTPPGVLLRRVAELCAEPLAPVPLLSVLKHPMVACGLAPGDARRHVRALELTVLRGVRPATGMDGLRAAVAAAPVRGGVSRDALLAFVERVADALSPLITSLAESADARAHLHAHIAACEALCATATQPGADMLWAEEAGEAAANFVHGLDAALAGMPATPGAAYPGTLAAFLAGHDVRPRFGRHPRLAILGPMEARLQHFDRVILGGLVEGTWPPDPGIDPWLSRPMKRTLGLPAPEFRIGQAAHDFAQLVCAEEVILSRPMKAEGTPTVPARWLLRLETVLQADGREPADLRDASAPVWWRGLDSPGAVTPAPAPAPCPPVALRPRRLSVTRIEAWMRDPYQIFAREILGLAPLDPVDQSPGARDWGLILHAGLEGFLKEMAERVGTGPLPADARARLLAHGAEAFQQVESQPGLRAFGWPRFRRAGDWLLATEAERRAAGHGPVGIEVRGELHLDCGETAFTLTAKADRIDQLRDGSLEIIDYKTGAPPHKSDITLGYAPQLALEALMARAGAFAGVPAGEVTALAFWQLGGGEPPGKLCPVQTPPDALISQAQAGLQHLVRCFADPAQPYHAMPEPARAPGYNDYAHLARIGEWDPAGGDGEAGA